MVDITDENKKAIREIVKRLLKRGITSNSELKRKVKKQGGYLTTRRYMKKIKLEIANEFIEPPKQLHQQETLLPYQTVKKLVYPAIKKIETSQEKPHLWYTPPCPKCKRCFPISSCNPIESRICIECGYSFNRVLGTHRGVWKKLESQSEQVQRTNTKWI